MKLFRPVALCAALLLTGSVFSAIAQYNPANYMAQGGADWEVGGVLNIKSGGKLEVNGADVTSSVSGSAVAGVAAGYIVARGETALGGTNPTAVTTGLTTIVACSLTIKTTAAPGVSTSVVTYGSSSGTLNMYGWKVTNSSTTTLVASSGTDTVGWVCVGT